MKKNILTTALGLGFVSILTLGMVTAPTLTNEVNQTSVWTEDYEWTGPSSSYDYENMSGIVDDAEEKANNGNASVYFLQRAGIFITIQYVFSIFNVLQINPNKEIYICVSTTANGNVAIENINWQYIEDTYPNVHFDIVTNYTIDSGFFDQWIPPTIEIDLYLDALTTDGSQNNIVTDIGAKWTQISSITFAADGMGTGVSNPTPGTYKKYVENNISYDDIVEYKDEWVALMENGTLPTQEAANFMHETLFSYTNIDSDPENEFQYWGVSYDQFTKGNLVNVTNEVPIDLENAWNTLTTEMQDEIKIVYNVDEQIKPVLEASNGFENIIYSGVGMMDDPTSKIPYETNILEQVIDYYGIGKDENLKLLYKPHPRENSDNIEQLWQNLQTYLGQTPTETAPSWFVVIPQQIPIEILGLAHIFENDASTTYEYIFSGTSTVVAAWWSAGLSETISFTTIPYQSSTFEYLPDENLLVNLQWIYGEDTEIYDWDKVVQVDDNGNLNYSKPFDWAMFHVIFWPIFASVVAGSIGFYFYWRDKKNKKTQDQ